MKLAHRHTLWSQSLMCSAENWDPHARVSNEKRVKNTANILLLLLLLLL